jgi:hypothetical protein
VEHFFSTKVSVQQWHTLIQTTQTLHIFDIRWSINQTINPNILIMELAHTFDNQPNNLWPYSKCDIYSEIQQSYHHISNHSITQTQSYQRGDRYIRAQVQRMYFFMYFFAQRRYSLCIIIIFFDYDKNGDTFSLVHLYCF